MTVLIPQTRKNSTEKDNGQCRQSMFGLKTPISNCRRRNDLDDFDGIRSILSHSSVEDHWTRYVQNDGSLFYVLVKESCSRGKHKTTRCYYHSDTEHDTEMALSPSEKLSSNGHNEVNIREARLVEDVSCNDPTRTHTCNGHETTNSIKSSHDLYTDVFLDEREQHILCSKGQCNCRHRNNIDYKHDINHNKTTNKHSSDHDCDSGIHSDSDRSSIDSVSSNNEKTATKHRKLHFSHMISFNRLRSRFRLEK